jgi:hypothetical protein
MHWLDSDGCCKAVVIENLGFCCCLARLPTGQGAIFTGSESPFVSRFTAECCNDDNSYIIQIRKNIDKKQTCQRSKVNRQSQ